MCSFFFLLYSDKNNIVCSRFKTNQTKQKNIYKQILSKRINTILSKP